MAPQTPSRATLADVLAAIEATQPVGARRNDMLSAVRGVAEALARKPEEIEADPRRLAIRLKSVSAVSLGVTERRWNNIRSLFRQALSLVTSVMPGRSEVPLSPDWAQLMEHLSGNRADRIRVIRLVRWLSGQGLAPAVVQAADLERFQAALTGEALACQAGRDLAGCRPRLESLRQNCTGLAAVADRAAVPEGNLHAAVVRLSGEPQDRRRWLASKAHL